MTQLLYTAELALNPEDRKDFLDWYAYRHAPDLYAIGFKVCTCYQAIIGDMTFFDLYEIDGLEVFDSAGYARMAANDLYAAEILARRRDKAHTLYRQHFLAPVETHDAPTLDADWLSVLRFDATSNFVELVQTLAADAADLVCAGAVRVRLAERSGVHPVYTTSRPQFMIVVEWSRKPDDAKAQLLQLQERLRPFVSEMLPFFGNRVFPWPNLAADTGGSA
ncbi:hypothetical protein [Hoeflea sp.]|uniref:hypothetical protein n=1 Tax=Hoeflea sp. TaxID=1940281 RepID=UPI003A948223